MFIKSSCLSVFGMALLAAPTFLNAHAGPLNGVAVKACADKVKSQSCKYEGGHNDLYIGSCQYMADDLMCVRSQPIQKIDNGISAPIKSHTHEKEKSDLKTNFNKAM
ncbi:MULTISPECIES: hypothetical protein [unclassified Pseudoalteromonas]|uniref:hypothetical protein n=1 Tax=unclassified Pseudoalteromonas TaxID=194690 RepID=UPI0016047EBB|nr:MULTISPECIES: hypothetical protein [unclassified Pseudoalteromonas]MBB1350231.1 hypothetical protein [Pseudoalteromonas sp. SG45-3]MBB1359569.1 hypothetical protein [Pseudoalteromonas sp. SG45-6]